MIVPPCAQVESIETNASDAANTYVATIEHQVS